MQSDSCDDRFEWWHHEPGRLDADRRQLNERFPGLTWSAHENGQWAGELPMWPFDRDPPDGLGALLGGRGLEVLVRCGQAYPVAAPRIVPLDPQPEIAERTQQRWHVNGDGTLCLFQSEAVWTPRATLADVLLKAAGWRIEYALMKTGLIDTMTINGVVTDNALDATIATFGVTGRVR
ncbi:hypothetical protein [Mycobacterium sp. MS1601]|uniref:hypothetical protein n=1 Tax=Mycobacterium sp. MS1601 TaxID=1936029 RepID=UPI0009F915AD|nr:hypothetical protein [Mycobacterium sp. MS1601]